MPNNCAATCVSSLIIFKICKQDGQGQKLGYIGKGIGRAWHGKTDVLTPCSPTHQGGQTCATGCSQQCYNMLFWNVAIVSPGLYNIYNIYIFKIQYTLPVICIKAWIQKSMIYTFHYLSSLINWKLVDKLWELLHLKSNSFILFSSSLIDNMAFLVLNNL